MTRSLEDSLEHLRAAADAAEAAVLASETDVPDWIVAVIGAARALLRDLEAGRVPAIPDRAAVVLPRSQSVACGYTGDACPNCGSFTLRRKGTCLSCDSCSHSSGCS